MKPAETNRFNVLYQRHLRLLKLHASGGVKIHKKRRDKNAFDF